MVMVVVLRRFMLLASSVPLVRCWACLLGHPWHSLPQMDAAGAPCFLFLSRWVHMHPTASKQGSLNIVKLIVSCVWLVHKHHVVCTSMQ